MTEICGKEKLITLKSKQKKLGTCNKMQSQKVRLPFIRKRPTTAKKTPYLHGNAAYFQLLSNPLELLVLKQFFLILLNNDSTKT